MDVTQVLESTLSPGMFFYFIFYIILFFLSFFLFLAIFLIYSSIVTLADRMFFPLVLQMRRHVPTPNSSSSTLPRPTLYVLLLFFFFFFSFFFSFTIMSHVVMGWNGIANIS